MGESFINTEFVQTFAIDQFQRNKPFPWFNFHHFLTPEAFTELWLNFPSLELFETHNGIQRNYGQRPHNRYYLAYETSIYQPDSKQASSENKGNKGTVQHRELPQVWQAFIEELDASPVYAEFIRNTLGIEDYHVRYAWHMGHHHSEVSPHRDAIEKVGTHIFYFNTDTDWDMAWGGETLVLGNKRTDLQNPDFSDFTEMTASQITNNHSFLFKNTDNAWHGVKAISCPPDAYRKLFNVIFELPESERPINPAPSSSLLSRGKHLLKQVVGRFA